MQVRTENIIDQRTVDMFTLMLLDNGIMHCHVSEKEIEIENLKRVAILIGEMTGGKAVPIIITLDETFNPNAVTRAYWAKKESLPYSLGEAYITKSIAHKLIGNFYLSYNKPERPTRIFTSEEAAFEWLEKLM